MSQEINIIMIINIQLLKKKYNNVCVSDVKTKVIKRTYLY